MSDELSLSKYRHVALGARSRDESETRRGAPLAADLPGTAFDPHLLVFRLVPGEPEVSRLAITSTRLVIDYFRRTIISVTPEPVPEYISGHQANGSPSDRPHAAFLPLAAVEDHHADAGLLGLAVALPRALPEDARRSCLRALSGLASWPSDGGPGKLIMGSLGRWRLEPIDAATPTATLRTETWTRPAPVWASVTPVVLDRFTRNEDEKHQTIADACEHVGLPRPAEVRTSHRSAIRGAPPSPAFGHLLSSKRRPTRPFTHVLLVFRSPEGRPVDVQGPLLIGAGRYRGYGLLRPLESTGGSRA